MKKRSKFVLVALPTLLFFLFFFFYICFNLQLKSRFRASSNNQVTILNQAQNRATSRFSLLIGVLTQADKYDRRNLLRSVYGIQSSSIAKIDVKFVFCNLTTPEQRLMVSVEILRFDDIIILNCAENMNNGKTYAYFSSLPRILPQRYDYIMKADDDIFIRLEQLSLSLEPLPRHDLYYGYVIPCESRNAFANYMSGMGFVVSWDLVEWIAESEIAANITNGPEDLVVGKWLKIGRKGKNRFSEKPGMYDYPGSGKCSHELIADTVAVHRLKRREQWFHVIEFFNLTKKLKQSGLSHLYD